MNSHDSNCYKRQLVLPTSEDDTHINNIKLDSTIVPLTNILNELVQLKYFLLTGPAQLRTQNGIYRHTLPNKDQISCVVWRNVYFITGTDIVRCLSFRFEAFGREITNRKKFEEGIFSDLRNLKCDTDAVLEQPKSEFLDYLYRNNCVRTQKKQKIFYWFSVNHDRLFQDALERDLKKELTSKSSSTTPVRDPALSFQYDGSRTLHDQLPDIIEKFPKHLADLTDASSIMSNVPFQPGQMMVMAPPPLPSSENFGSTPTYVMLGGAEGMTPMSYVQSSMVQPNTCSFYSGNSDLVVPQTAATTIMSGRPQYEFLQSQQLKLVDSTSNNRPSSLVQTNYSQDNQFTTHSITAEASLVGETPTVANSDFPLDYVDTTGSAFSSQMFLGPTESTSSCYLPSNDQVFSNKNEYIGFYNTGSAATSTSPAKDISTPITYDNQQFQVVYHQDSAGNFLSSMVPLQPTVLSNVAATKSSTASPNLLLTTASTVSARGNVTKDASQGEIFLASPLMSVPTGGEFDSSDSSVKPTKNSVSSLAVIKTMHSPSLHPQQRQQSSKQPIKIKEEDYHSGSSNNNSPVQFSVKRPASDDQSHSTKRTKLVHSSGDKSFDGCGQQSQEYQSATYFMLTPSESGCGSDVGPGLSSFLPESPNEDGHNASGFSTSFKRPGGAMVTVGSGVGGVPKRSSSAQRLPLVYQSSPVSQGDFFEDAVGSVATAGTAGTSSNSSTTSASTGRKYLTTAFNGVYNEEWI